MTDDPPRLPIAAEFLFRIVIETEKSRVRVLGGTPFGTYVDVAVVGGTVAGPKINGTVLNMGGDWGLTRLQGGAKEQFSVTDLDCKLLIQTNDEVEGPEHEADRLIQMSYTGISFYYPGASTDYPAGAVMDRSSYYFRTTPRFQTASARYDHLNRTVAVASGYHRKNAGPIYDVYAIA